MKRLRNAIQRNDKWEIEWCVLLLLEREVGTYRALEILCGMGAPAEKQIECGN